MSHAVQSTITNSRFDMMALPPELRVIVYELAFSNFDLDIKDRKKFTKSLQPALLNVDTALRHEALKFYAIRLDQIRMDSWQLAEDTQEKLNDLMNAKPLNSLTAEEVAERMKVVKLAMFQTRDAQKVVESVAAELEKAADAMKR